MKLFQYCSILFDLHNKELCDGYLRLNVIYDATVGLQLRGLWSEVLACFANCWQKIVISPPRNVGKYLALYVNELLE